MTLAFNDFLHELRFDDIPAETLYFVKRCLLDLIGVAAAGSTTPLSNIIRQHAVDHFGAGQKSAQLLFDSRCTSPVGAALANATTIDSMDAHDGLKPTKGHVGCGVLPALLALTQAEKILDEREFLMQLLIGYELGSRAGVALHQTACDYHTSGAWVTIACAAMGARALGLNAQQTREAIGIAEYHGPRSQMMRTIDAPTMVKDGSGWGAMAGVSAAYLAESGYTGAPALTVEADDVADIWADLGQRWYIKEQYFKPYPVCRWAQPPVVATWALCNEHSLTVDMIESIEVITFHEAKRLATTLPETTEQAQYSLPYAVAAALVYGEIGPDQVSQAALSNPEIHRLSSLMILLEDDEYNAVFPERRIARVVVHTKRGKRYESAPTEAKGDPEAHLSDDEIREKFHRFADPVIGVSRSKNIEAVIDDLGNGNQLNQLLDLITAKV
ncbi:MAG: 2-methylcitrate dehydratase PrpD [Gammaproteobacteria bacterium]|jgi:2-methylcitrate dehydratase PrpD